MGNLFTAGLFRQMLRSATPVGLAAMGGLMTEHAGIMNIGMDGMILMGAFTAVAVSWLAGSAWLGLVAAILVGILVGLFFALFVVKFQSDEFIIGTALNIFAGGLTVFLLRTLFQVKGTFQGTPDRPVVGLPQVDLGFLKQIPFLGDVLEWQLPLYFPHLGPGGPDVGLCLPDSLGLLDSGRRGGARYPSDCRNQPGEDEVALLRPLRRFLRPGRGPAGPGQCDHVCRGHE